MECVVKDEIRIILGKNEKKLMIRKTHYNTCRSVLRLEWCSEVFLNILFWNSLNWIVIRKTEVLKWFSFPIHRKTLYTYYRIYTIIIPILYTILIDHRINRVCVYDVIAQGSPTHGLHVAPDWFCATLGPFPMKLAYCIVI